MESIFKTVFGLSKTRQPIPFSSIPEPLLKDFLKFIEGRTILKREGELMVQPDDFRHWLQKLNTKGIDYEIHLGDYES